jgi:hypothetical protein
MNSSKEGGGEACDARCVHRWGLACLGVALSSTAVLATGACAGTFCSSWSSSLLCDDFDKSSSVTQEGLPQQTGTSGGSFVLSGQSAYTFPNSALAMTNAFDGGPGASAQLNGALWSGVQPPPGVLTCNLEIQPALLSTVMGDTASVMTLAVTDSAGIVRVQLSVVVDTAGNLSFQEEYGAATTLSGPADGGLSEAGAFDGAPDAQASDARVPDARSSDTGLPDAPSSDGDLPDTSSGDADVPEAGVPESGVLDDGGTASLYGLQEALGVGVWTFLELQLTTSPSATLFSVTAGGPGVSGALQQPLPSPMGATLVVGPTDLGAASGGWSFYYDNVVCY